nr:hypothetical protein [Tanacetum cinerariifolium]
MYTGGGRAGDKAGGTDRRGWRPTGRWRGGGRHESGGLPADGGGAGASQWWAGRDVPLVSASWARPTRGEAATRRRGGGEAGEGLVPGRRGWRPAMLSSCSFGSAH